MNATNQPHDPAQPDDLPDRLVDLALSELIGGNAPPDLSSRIAAATFQQTAAVAQVPRTRQDRAFWVNLAVAVMLLIGVTIVLLPQLRSDRHKSVDVAELGHQIQTRHDPSQAFPIASTPPLGEGEPETVRRRLNEQVPNNPVAQQTSQKSNSYREMLNGKGQGPGSKANSTLPRLSAAEDAKVQRTAAKTDDFDSLADLMQSTVTSDSYAMGDGKEAKSPSNLSLQISQTQSIPEVQEAIQPAPELSVELLNPYAGDDIVPGLKSGEELGLDKSGPHPHPALAGAKRIAALRGANTPGVIRAQESPEGRPFSFPTAAPEGAGPDLSGDKYTRIVENTFIKAEGGAAVSTFSIDVDTASYSNVRQFLMDSNRLPPPDAVRIEELINYFQYGYEGPKQSDEAPFAAHVEVTGCPWAPEHRLARIGIKGRDLDRSKRPQSNLVFLVDVSGSMDEPKKLPLVIYGLEQLTRELGENDRVAIVVYANTEGLVLPSTRGDKQDTILAALARLKAGGSTAGGAGIQLAYQLAEDNFIKGGTNRVILCTDGDFNVGVTNTAELERLVEKKAKDTGVFLSVLGFGRGNLNDTMMEAISNHGNGNYHYVDNRSEARRVLVEQMTGTLITIAKDVKIQVEFNPTQVAGYRLIGYEDRMLRTEDFNDDKKDAGEIGAGHTVTALYEIVPAGKKIEIPPVDELKYQKPPVTATEPADKAAAMTKELLTLKMRYKAPDGDTSKKLEWPVTDDGKAFSAASGDLKFAASVAGFGLLLRNSEYKGNLTYAATLELAQGGVGDDAHGYRKEFLDMVRKAKELRHE